MTPDDPLAEFDQPASEARLREVPPNGSQPKVAPREDLLIRLADVRSRSVRWLWEGRLPIGYLVVQSGVEGLGKSLFAAWMVARLSRGELPGEYEGSPTRSLVIAGEDAINDTWKPRLELAGVDPEHVALLDLPKMGDAWNVMDIEPLAGAVLAADAGLVFIDALLDHMPPPHKGEGVNQPTFVRRALGPLKRLAREAELTCLFSLHPPKNLGNQARDMVQASQAFSAVARSALLFGYHPDDDRDDDDRRRVLLRGEQSNLGRNPGALEFRVVGRSHLHDDGRETEREVVEDVRPSSITLADLQPNRAVGAREPTKHERATEYLRGALGDHQWHEAAAMMAQLDAQGISARTVQNAATELGVRREKNGRDGGWLWWLPSEDATERT